MSVNIYHTNAPAEMQAPSDERYIFNKWVLYSKIYCFGIFEHHILPAQLFTTWHPHFKQTNSFTEFSYRFRYAIEIVWTWPKTDLILFYVHQFTVQIVFVFFGRFPLTRINNMKKVYTIEEQKSNEENDRFLGDNIGHKVMFYIKICQESIVCFKLLGFSSTRTNPKIYVCIWNAPLKSKRHSNKTHFVFAFSAVNFVRCT